jgi:acetylglutamate kinase
MDDAIRKAEVLIEAQSYIRKFRDRLTVIKLGGSAMEDPRALGATLQDVVFMETVGLRPVLVHGGGKAIDRAMARAGLVPRKVRGRRYTDRATLDIVVRVLLHDVNAGLVAQVRRLGGRAIALYSGSLQCLFGQRLRLPPAEDAPDESPDLGHVGEVTRVDAALIETFCAGGVVPVIPSLALAMGNEEEMGNGEWGMGNENKPGAPATGPSLAFPIPHSPFPIDGAGWLNVNADTAAAAVAGALRAEKLVVLTDTPGVLGDRADPSSLVPTLDAAGAADLMARGVIAEGMLPKVEACLDSLRAGVRKAHMIDGRLPHSLLLEIYTDRGVGTEITLGVPTPV